MGNRGLPLEKWWPKSVCCRGFWSIGSGPRSLDPMAPVSCSGQCNYPGKSSLWSHRDDDGYQEHRDLQIAPFGKNSGVSDHQDLRAVRHQNVIVLDSPAFTLRL